MPTAALPKFSREDEVKGINAVLLGPPGSGKGTQVCVLSIYLLYYIIDFLGSKTQRKILCLSFIYRGHVKG